MAVTVLLMYGYIGVVVAESHLAYTPRANYDMSYTLKLIALTIRVNPVCFQNIGQTAGLIKPLESNIWICLVPYN